MYFYKSNFIADKQNSVYSEISVGRLDLLLYKMYTQTLFN